MMKKYQQNSHLLTVDSGNIFLTSTLNNNSPKRLYTDLKSHKQIDQRKKDDKSVQSLRKKIIELIRQFRSLPLTVEISHQFNEILYSIDTDCQDKREIRSIIYALGKQMNVIKLERLYNRLKKFQKQLLKLKTKQRNILPKASSAQSLAKLPIYRHSSFSKLQGGYRCEKPQAKDMKEKIAEEICYRERLEKIKSEHERFSLNKERFMKKRIQKVKNMNKKVHQIYEKNKKLQKQRISKYKYQQLFDPSQIKENAKRRAQMMGNYQKATQSQNSIKDQLEDECYTYPINNLPKSGTRLSLLCNSQQNISKKDFLRESKVSKKQGIQTFKSLNELMKNNVRPQNSYQDVFKKNELFPKKDKQSVKNQLNKPLSKSFTLTYDKLKSIKKEQQKIHQAQQKKQRLQEQSFRRNVKQAVQKERKIIQIHNKIMMKRKLKNISSKSTLRNGNSSKSLSVVEQSAQKSKQNKIQYKLSIPKIQNIDRQRQIFNKIQNKVQRREQFLKERVNRIRERFERQEEIKENHRLKNDRQSLTQNVSRIQSKLDSPKKQYIHRRISMDKFHQNKIRQSFLNKQKQNNIRQMQRKFANLSLDDLKRKLIVIEKQQKKL